MLSRLARQALLLALCFLGAGCRAQRSELADLDELIRFLDKDEIDESRPFFQKPDHSADHHDTVVFHDADYQWKHVQDHEVVRSDLEGMEFREDPHTGRRFARLLQNSDLDRMLRHERNEWRAGEVRTALESHPDHEGADESRRQLEDLLEDLEDPDKIVGDEEFSHRYSQAQPRPFLSIKPLEQWQELADHMRLDRPEWEGLDGWEERMEPGQGDEPARRMVRARPGSPLAKAVAEYDDSWERQKHRDMMRGTNIKEDHWNAAQERAARRLQREVHELDEDDILDHLDRDITPQTFLHFTPTYDWQPFDPSSQAFDETVEGIETMEKDGVIYKRLVKGSAWEREALARQIAWDAEEKLLYHHTTHRKDWKSRQGLDASKLARKLRGDEESVGEGEQAEEKEEAAGMGADEDEDEEMTNEIRRQAVKTGRGGEEAEAEDDEAPKLRFESSKVYMPLPGAVKEAALEMDRQWKAKQRKRTGRLDHTDMHAGDAALGAVRTSIDKALDDLGLPAIGGDEVEEAEDEQGGDDLAGLLDELIRG